MTEDRLPPAWPARRGDRAGSLRPCHDRHDERLALAVFSAGSRITRAGETHELDVDGCDLSRLNTGRCPLLIEHGRFLDHLIGVVEEAWVEDGTARAVVRFSGVLPRAVELHDALCEAVPLACSAGYDILEAEPAPGAAAGAPHYRIRRWRPVEISVCVAGADSEARLCAHPVADIAATRDVRRAIRRDAERQARLAALRAEAWRDWAAGPAAAALAQELRVPVDRAAAVLARLTGRHLSELEAAVARLDAARAEAEAP